MKYNATSLLHTAWTEDEKISLDDAILFVEEYSGNNFIDDIAKYLFQLLKTDYIIIAGLNTPTDKFLKSVVLLEKGKIIANQLYKIDGTPFGVVLDNDFSYYPFGLPAIFPDDKTLQELQLESFIGIPLFDDNDQTLGVFALMHHAIIERAGFVEALLNAILPRIEKDLAQIISVDSSNSYLYLNN